MKFILHITGCQRNLIVQQALSGIQNFNKVFKTDSSWKRVRLPRNYGQFPLLCWAISWGGGTPAFEMGVREWGMRESQEVGGKKSTSEFSTPHM